MGPVGGRGVDGEEACAADWVAGDVYLMPWVWVFEVVCGGGSISGSWGHSEQ